MPNFQVHHRCLVFRTDINPVHRRPSFGINADENASPGDIGRFIDDRPFFESQQRRFDLAEPLIDLFGQFVCVLIVKFQLGLLGVECFNGRLLLVRSAGLPTSSRRPLVWPNGKPTPTEIHDRFGLSRELFGDDDETIEQGDILKPTAVIVLKEVPQDAATCLLVGTESNEAHTAVGGADGRFRQHSPDLIGLIIAGAIDVFPDLLLSGMVSRDGKGHELLEGQPVYNAARSYT